MRISLLIMIILKIEIKEIRKHILRHVIFFINADGIAKHMKKHADIVRPKFEKALKIMKEELGEAELGEWTKPRETFPYGIDLEDRNIRIAPTCLSIENLSLATKLFCLCVKIVTIEKILELKVFEDSSSKI